MIHIPERKNMANDLSRHSLPETCTDRLEKYTSVTVQEEHDISLDKGVNKRVGKTETMKKLGND